MPNFSKFTGFLSEIGTKLRDWAVGQAGAGCYSQAALSSNDSKTRYYSRSAQIVDKGEGSKTPKISVTSFMDGPLNCYSKHGLS